MLFTYSTNYRITEGVSSSHAVITAARELHNATLQCEAKQRRPVSVPEAGLATEPAGTGPTADTDSAYDVLTAKLEIHVTCEENYTIHTFIVKQTLS